MEKYHSSGTMGESFSGFGTFWWDSKAQVYRGMWCDNMTPGGCDASGTTKWEGDNLVGTKRKAFSVRAAWGATLVKGTATFTPGPGGMSLMEKYHSSGTMGESFSGFGTFWWDSKAQVYRGMWCDNMTPGGCDASGTTKWEGDNLVGTMEGEMNGQKMTTRFTYSDWKPNSFVMTMDSGPDANSLKPMMTITYTKAAKAAKTEAMSH